MLHSSIIIAPFWSIKVLFIISLHLFNPTIFEKPQDKMIIALLFQLTNFSKNDNIIYILDAHLTSQIDINTIVNTIVVGIFGIIVAFIGFRGATFAHRLRQRREKEKKQKKAETSYQLKTGSQFAYEYRQALLEDTFITTFQILGMKHPLRVADVYVPLRLSLEERSIEELALEAKYDPMKLLEANYRQEDNHERKAMEPGKAINECLNRRCIILGDAGSGKTTLLKYLVVKSAEGTLDDLSYLNLPIYISLNAFVNSGRNNLLDYFVSDWGKKYSIDRKLVFACIEEHLKNGQALLLFDGLNETAVGKSFEDAEDSFRRVVDEIERVSSRYPRTSIVITTRKIDYKEDGFHQHPLLKGFTQLEVLDFQPEDIREYVESWFDNHHRSFREELSERLNEVIENDPRIQALARNPLLLAVIAIVYEETQRLPQGRGRLYKQCADILLARWDDERGLHYPRQFTLENMEKLLEAIAWHFHKEGQRFFSKDQLSSVIEDFLPAIDIESKQNARILEAIISESGLLKEHAKGWYGFLHLTMQEYFVAQHIKKHGNFEELLKHGHEPWWEEILLLYAVAQDASRLLENLLEHGKAQGLQKDIFHTNLILAGRCIASHPTVTKVQIREDIIFDLFEIFMSTPFSLTRQQTIEILVESGGVKINERLLALLSDKNVQKDLQIAIVDALASVGDRERSLMDLMIRKLSEDDTDINLCKQIVTTLGRIGNRSTSNSLLVYLLKLSIDDRIRESIVNALGMLGASRKLEDNVGYNLFQLLTRKQMNQFIRQRIAIALGRCGNSPNFSLTPSLVGLLSDEDVEIQVRIGIVDALRILGDTSVSDKLGKLISHKQLDYEVRMRIVDTLGVLGGYNNGIKTSVLHKLWEVLHNPGERSEVRGHAAIALGMLEDLMAHPVSKDRSISEVLLELLFRFDSDAFLKQSCIIALGKLVKRFPGFRLSQEHTIELLAILSSPKSDLGVRICIADFMGTRGDRIYVNDLLNILPDVSIDSRVRGAIVDALGKLGEQAVATSLFHLLSQPNIELDVCGRIAYVLCLLRYKEVFPAALKLLAEDKIDLQIRRLIADGLGTLGEDARASEMIPLLSKPEIDLSVRQHVANVLSRISFDEESVIQLASLLQNSDIADDIHRTLWVVSRRIGVRIIMRGSEPEIVHWRDILEVL